MRRLFANRLALISLLCAGWVAAAAQAVPNRIVQEINANETAVLPGSVNPRIAPQYETGRMQPGTQLDGMTVYFQPTAEQKAELDALVKAQQTPGSPEYHQWLTPAQYAARFGLSQADIGKVENWLESEGFNVERVSPSLTSITFSGTVEQVETAFSTEMHTYRIDGEEHWANSTNLSIPEALSGVVQAVRNLNDFRPRPQVRFYSQSAMSARPAFTSGQTGDHFLTPDDVATIYDIANAYNAGYTGSGETIAVVGQSEIETSDIENFEKALGLPTKDPTMTLVSGTGSAAFSSGDEAESDLDVEYSGAIAKGATIHFYYSGSSGNVFDALQYAIDQDKEKVISISYGGCETQFVSDQSDYAALETEMEKGAAQGQSIIASSGDTGSTACYGTTGYSTAQQEALAVNYPASSAFVTGIGGTEFPTLDVSGSSSGTYWESASGSDRISSAKSYIPEEVWNDDATTSQGLSAGNADALSAGGGGVSVLTPRPGWQSGVPGIPSGSYRLVPDISLDASNVNAPYLYCTSDQSAWNTGSPKQQASCNDGFRDSATGDLTAAGGTSFGAPIFAGMMAIVNQKTSSAGQGVAATELYALAANSATYAAAFHDITSGGNQCTAGSSFCSSAGASEYPATADYDEASGLGSVDFDALLTAWGASTAPTLEGSTTTVTAANTTDTAGTADAITITVTPSSSTVTGTPTGSVAVTVNGATGATLQLTNGTATYSFKETVNGTYTIAATYSGDSTFSSSTGTATVTVTGGTNPASFTLSASPATITVNAGSSGTSAITVTPQTGYSGTVNFVLNVSGSNASSLEDYGCYTLNGATVAGGAAATSTLTIYTSESACNAAGAGIRKFEGGGTTAENRSPFGGTVPLGAATLGGLLLFGFRRSRSRVWTMLGCLMLMTAVGGFSLGCGSTAGTATTTTTKSTSGTVPAGSYSLAVVGTDSVNSSLTASTNLTLTVN